MGIDIDKLNDPNILTKVTDLLQDEEDDEEEEEEHHSKGQVRDGNGKFVKMEKKEYDNYLQDNNTNKMELNYKTIIAGISIIILTGLLSVLYVNTRTSASATSEMTLKGRGLEYIRYCEEQGLDRSMVFKLLNNSYNEHEGKPVVEEKKE